MTSFVCVCVFYQVEDYFTFATSDWSFFILQELLGIIRMLLKYLLSHHLRCRNIGVKGVQRLSWSNIKELVPVSMSSTIRVSGVVA